MKASDDDLREALGLGRARRMGERAACPSPEELAMQAEDEGDATTRGRVLEHAAQCAHCAFELRLAASLRPWAHSAAFALGADAPPVPRVRWRPAWLPAALAASLLIGAGLAGWNMSLHQRGLDLQAQLATAHARELEAGRRSSAAEAALATARTPVAVPVLNVPIVDLEAGSGRGAGVGAATLRVAPGATWATFVLTVAGVANGGPHALAIEDEHEHVVWRGDGLVPNRYGTFTVAVPQALLPPGRYAFVLSRPDGAGGTRPVASYRLIVSAKAP